MPPLPLVLLLVLLVLLWVGPMWRPRPLAGLQRARPWALGHRGVRHSLPENTLAAFRKALDAGLDGLETDVQRTRDGTLVLFHDFEIAGRKVTELTASELRALTPDLATLPELLELMRDYPGTLLNVELKILEPNDRGLVAAVAAALRASGLQERLLVSSFSPFALAQLYWIAPELRRAYLWFEEAPTPPLLRSPWPAGFLHVDAMHPHHRAATPERVAGWRSRGLMVNCWTANEASDVQRALRAQVDGVMGDDPAELLKAMGRASG